MSYGDITVNTKTYEPRAAGVYSESTVTLGDPQNQFRLRAPSGVSRDGLLRGSVTRVLEKDVTVGDDVERKQAVVTLQVATPPADFTGSDLDGLASDISEFVTADIVSSLLQGKI